jgi:protein-tyrosine phosphatase
MGLLGNIFGGNKILFEDFSKIRVDVHSHLLPGIDDGSKSYEESVALIKELQKLGYQKLIVTPHVMSDYYKNTKEGILKAMELLKDTIAVEGVDMELHAAAEYFADFHFMDLIERDELLTLKDNLVLFELSYYNPPPNLNELVFKLQTGGYQPVLAHPERYGYWHKDFEKYEQLKDRGVLFQLNINSLSGQYSAAAKKVAEKLIMEDYIDLIGTDMHSMMNIPFLHNSRKNKYLYDLIESDRLLNSTF